MPIYQISRNIESSIIDHIRQLLIDGHWLNISVEKVFAKIYSLPEKVPGICVLGGDTVHKKAEISTNSTERIPNVMIHIFATDDGMRLDLKDYLVGELKHGIPFYKYVIEKGAGKTKTADGRLRTMFITERELNKGVDKSLLDTHDRYRQLISLTLSTGKIEA